MRLIPCKTSSTGFVFVIFTILLLLLTAPLTAAGGELSLIGSGLLTDVQDVDYHGSRVLGAFGGGAILLDFSDPGSPSHVGYLSTHEPCQDVILTDSIAFLSCGEQGVLLVAVGDSLADGPRSTIETAGTAAGIFLEWPLLYVATQGFGLEVFDISSPVSPIPRGKLTLAGVPGEVWVEGGEACVTGHDGWLWVIDLSDPDSLTLLRSTRTEGLQAWDVTRFGQTVYVADYRYLDSYDRADLGLRQLFTTPGRATDLFLEYPRLYLSDNMAGTHLFSVSSDGELTYVVTFPSLVPSDDSWGVAARHDTVIIGEDMTGVIMVDWSDPLQPGLSALYPVPGEIMGAKAIGNGLIAVAEWIQGLRIVRMKANGDVEQVSLTNVDSTLKDIEVQDTLAYLPAGSHGIRVVDISDPAAPVPIAAVTTGRSVSEVRVSGERLYAVDGDFKVVDITDPTDPILAGSLITPTFSNDLSLKSPDVICVAEAESGLIVISAPPGGQPQIIGRKATGGYVQGVFVQEDVAFLADKDSGLVVMDISDPSNIVTVGNVAVDGIPIDVVVSGERALLGLEEGGVVEIDVSDGHHPLVLDRYDTPGETHNLSIATDSVIVATAKSLILLRAEGVGISSNDGFTTQPPRSISLLQNYPNPFNPSTTILITGDLRGSTGFLSIHDVRGRMVRRLPVTKGSGKVLVHWDGENSRGISVPSGVYFYRLEGTGEVRKMLLLR